MSLVPPQFDVFVVKCILAELLLRLKPHHVAKVSTMSADAVMNGGEIF